MTWQLRDRRRLRPRRTHRRLRNAMTGGARARQPRPAAIHTDTHTEYYRYRHGACARAFWYHLQHDALYGALTVYSFMQAAKETALNLAKYVDKAIHVKFSGGREGAIARATCVSTSVPPWPTP